MNSLATMLSDLESNVISPRSTAEIKDHEILDGNQKVEALRVPLVDVQKVFSDREQFHLLQDSLRASNCFTNVSATHPHYLHPLLRERLEAMRRQEKKQLNQDSPKGVMDMVQMEEGGPKIPPRTAFQKKEVSLPFSDDDSVQEVDAAESNSEEISCGA